MRDSGRCRAQGRAARARRGGASSDARLLGDLVVGAALAQLDDADRCRRAGRRPASCGRCSIGDAPAPERGGRARAAARRSPTTGSSSSAARSARSRRSSGATGARSIGRSSFRRSAHGGFDAIVGNPPFQGGKKITRRARHAVPRLPGEVARRRRARQRRPRRVLLPASRRAPARERRFRADRDQHARAGRHARGRAGPTRRARCDDPPRDRERAMAGRGEPRDGDRLGAARRLGWRATSSIARRSAGSPPRSQPRSRVEGSGASASNERRALVPGLHVLGLGFVLSPDEAGADACGGRPKRGCRAAVPHRRGPQLNGPTDRRRDG